MEVKTLINKIKKIEKSTDSRLHFIELFSDGSGCLKNDSDIELAEWDDIDEMRDKIGALIQAVSGEKSIKQ